MQPGPVACHYHSVPSSFNRLIGKSVQQRLYLVDIPPHMLLVDNYLLRMFCLDNLNGV